MTRSKSKQHKKFCTAQSLLFSFAAIVLAIAGPANLSGQIVTLQQQPAPAQRTERAQSVELAQNNLASQRFGRALRLAIRNARKAGEISRADAVRLRVALISPAFRKQAEDLAVIQMVFSGEGEIPTDETGKVERARIDWEALLDFLEKLIPLLLQLINGIGSTIHGFSYASGCV